MSFLDLFLPSNKTAGKAQISFDHPKVYNQLNSGNGPQGLSMMSHSLSQKIVSHLEAMDENLKRALKNSQGAWKGHAADSASSSTTPLSDAVQASRDNSAELGKLVERQAEHFGKVKTMPPPKKVESLDLGLAGYTPGGFLAEQVDKEIQERQANEVEEAARQQYTTYQESTNSTTGNMPRYSPVPNPLTSVGTAETRPPGTVDPNFGDLDRGGHSRDGLGDSRSVIKGSTDGTHDSSESSRDERLKQPANPPPQDFFEKDGIVGPDRDPGRTESQSHTPTPPTPPSTPGPTGQTPPSGPQSPPANGGMGLMPGAGGAGAVSGGSAGARGSMSGRIAPGGSSGVGGAGSTASPSGGASGATAARGGAGAGAMGGAGARGRGGEEDEEHQRKYVEDSDEPFEFEAEVDEEGNVVAPPVIGQYRPPSHYR